MPSGYLDSFIQTSLNAASEASRRIFSNSETNRDENNPTIRESNENQPTEIISDPNISESNENEIALPTGAPTNIIVNLGYFMQNSFNSAAEASQTLLENYGFTDRQGEEQLNEQIDRLVTNIDEFEIPDVVINMEPLESEDTESTLNQNLPPPSYNEVMKDETDITSPPPTYSEFLKSS